MFRDFMRDSTCHGVYHLGRVWTPCAKGFWCCIFLCAVGVVTYQLVGLITGFSEKPTVTRISVRYPQDGIPLPNLTVCILSRFNYTYVKHAYPNISINLLELISSSFLSAYSTTLYDMNYFRYGTKRNLSMLLRDYDDQFSDMNDVVEFIEDISFNCSALFPGRSCWFQNSYLFDCCKLAARFLSHNGPCFAFQYGAASEVGLNGFRQRLPGPVGGFGFLHVNPTPHVPPVVFNAYEEQALFLYLSPEDAILNRNPMAIVPGHHAHVSIDVINHISAPSFYFGQPCVSDRELEYFTGYTYSKCEVECMVKTFLHTCNCTGINTYLDMHPSLFCEPLAGLKCFHRNAYNLSGYLATCRLQNCSDACSWWEYSASVTIGRAYHAKFAKRIASYWRLDDSEGIEDHIILVDLYFHQIKYMEIQEVNALTLETFVSNVGGALGLWTGASIITIIHAMFYCCLQLWEREVKKQPGAGADEVTMLDRATVVISMPPYDSKSRAPLRQLVDAADTAAVTNDQRRIDFGLDTESVHSESVWVRRDTDLSKRRHNFRTNVRSSMRSLWHF